MWYQFSIDLRAIADNGVELVQEDHGDRDLALLEFRELRPQHLQTQLHVRRESCITMHRRKVSTRKKKDALWHSNCTVNFLCRP